MRTFVDFYRGLVQLAERNGWEVRGERSVQHGRLFELHRGGVRAVLTCYEGKKGLSAVVGGVAAEELRTDLKLAGPTASPGRADSGGEDPFRAGTPRVGGDESGKGDYFGPLVVAAFLLQAGDLPMLAALGVRDSKTIGDRSVERMAAQLTATGRTSVLVLDPPAYNRRYAQLNNVNLLLAQLYGECMRPLLEREPKSASIVIDRFTTRLAPLEAALAIGPERRLIAEPRGERDPAVAAASILARAAFLDGLRRLEHDFGQAFPPGAGDPVLVAGREFVSSFGAGRLEQVAKVHFATSAQL